MDSLTMVLDGEVPDHVCLPLKEKKKGFTLAHNLAHMTEVLL